MSEPTPERLRQLADFAEQSGNKPWLVEVATILRDLANTRPSIVGMVPEGNRVNIEDVAALHVARRRVNALELETIEFYHNGVRIVVPPVDIAVWRFVGLSNTEFVMLKLLPEAAIQDAAGRCK